MHDRVSGPPSSLGLEARVARDDRGARAALGVMVGVTLIVFWAVGRHQWFTRDDFAFALVRPQLRTQLGVADWLGLGQDGHFMAAPILIWQAILSVFGIDSYWPFLAVCMALHITACLLVWRLCGRVGVSAWTSTLLVSVLLVFGGGWENIVFAVQITFNLSLVMLLAQLLLVDHEGRPDRRDWLGAVCAVVGVASSGFGPIFTVGVGVLLALRQRWKALVVGCGPAFVVWVAWFLKWGSASSSNVGSGPRSLVPEFAARGVTATFEHVIGVFAFGPLLLLAAAYIGLEPRLAWRARSMVLAMWALLAVMFLGVGWTRIGFGVDSAAWPRYVGLAAMFMAPAIGLAIDRLLMINPTWLNLARILLLVSIVLNAVRLHHDGSTFAIRSLDAKRVFELVAASPDAQNADPTRVLVTDQPEVTVGALGQLVEQGAITPRPAANDEERALVRFALGLPND